MPQESVLSAAVKVFEQEARHWRRVACGTALLAAVLAATVLKLSLEQEVLGSDLAGPAREQASSNNNCCGPGCRHTGLSAVEGYYDAKYLAWQAKQGRRKARETNWTRLLGIRHGDDVLDFGAGTGAVLEAVSGARKRVAVELSASARKYMEREQHKITERYQYVEHVPDRSVSLAWSLSVIEHVECPIQELRELLRKLKPKGRLVLGVKNEGFEAWKHWDPANRDNHLWTWNSMLLGNTLRAAGFHVDEISQDDLRPNIKTENRFRVHREFEEAVVGAGFGRHRHIAQNLYAYAHRPTFWERRMKQPQGAPLVPCRGCPPILAARDRVAGKPMLYEPLHAKGFPSRGSGFVSNDTI